MACVVDQNYKRVLVIDDASLARLYYRDALERAGFLVDEALNGLEALEKLLVAPADLLIVDVNMPQMDGITFVKALRSRPLPVGSTPVMISTTESGPKDIAAARAAGANFYMIKPVNQELLVTYAALLCGVVT
jgi:two-component system chemotaxis response regulator CheY